MRAFFIALIALTAAACGSPEQAPATHDDATTPAAGVEISDAWAAPTPNGVDVSAGYLTITNGGSGDDTLLSAESPRAQRVEIHEMTMEGAVMRMRRLQGLVIPASGSATLAPGGQHLMFFGVTQPFTEGEEIAVRLTFEHAGAMDVSLPVRRAQTHGGGH